MNERIKELKIMEKTLKYLLIAAMIVLAGARSMVNAMPQGIATEPQIDMHSTSVMVGSGSHLPLAAETGAYTTSGEESGPPKGRPRRIVGDDDVGGDGDGNDDPTPADPADPFPIGDAGWTLLALAAAYAVLRVYRRKRVNGGRTA